MLIPAADNPTMPTHFELVPYILRAVVDLGGSAQRSEIVDHVTDAFPGGETLRSQVYPGRENTSIFENRIAFGISTSFLSGSLNRPSRGLYLVSDRTKELITKSDDEIVSIIEDFDRNYRAEKRAEKLAKNRALQKKTTLQANSLSSHDSGTASSEDDSFQKEIDTHILTLDDETADETKESDWKDLLLARLHQMDPIIFEKYVIYLLRRYGLRLAHIGGSGDEGIDAIGTAPLSPVLSSRVAVQIKRYDPNGKPIGRDTVALFQRDAQTKGAERAILVTLSRFTRAARDASIMTTPTVNLIDGEGLIDLIVKDGHSGVRMEPTIDFEWFDREFG